MIVYFADRQLNIVGQASSELPGGLSIIKDNKTEDIETGVAVFECTLPFDRATRADIEEAAAVGNYILRSHDGDNEFYTIIEAETDTKNQELYIYAEDAGLDLLNEVVGAYEADKAYSLAYYIEKFTYDSGFVIGINEAAGLTRKLMWDSEATAAERVRSVATQFDGCEISYSFDIDGLTITNKYINIYKERGKDVGVTLRLNKDIDRIVTTKSIANLATALVVTGGTPEDSETPITLSGYKYDDGDFYVDGTYLKSRKALQKWSRYNWTGEPNKEDNVGHIVKLYSYDTLSQSTLCAHAVTELKELCEMEVNYDVDITKLPDNVRIGDRVNIVDDAGGLYLSTRILKLETSVVDQEHKATLGEHLLKTSGISQKVAELAAQFAKNAQSAARALMLANNANTAAVEAKGQAEAAVEEAANAQTKADEAAAAVDAATEAAADAKEKAENAQSSVDAVEKSVESLEKTVADAQTAADNAQAAAESVQGLANEAAQSAANARADAADAKAAVGVAQSTAETAIATAETAVEAAETAKTDAATAQETAAAAKLDAERAQRDIDALGDELETVTTTMSADYARKTDLTETTAELQTQIAQNAAEIRSTASKVQRIDETTNEAQKQLQGAIAWAETATARAEEAATEAVATQAAADEAAQAAADAQAEADIANEAAENARRIADQAAADLKAAKADLETVNSRADATEDEIAAAEAAVETAQAAATQAKADVAAAIEEATAAQATATEAAASAAAALTTANAAASNAALAQRVADEANGDATAAQATAAQAAATAAEAQRTALTATENAKAAQSTADNAAEEAAAAQVVADNAATTATQAAADLAAAEQRLADVMANVDATEEEVAEAEAAVATAQAAADTAQAEAEAAQATADTAKADAEAAQTAADEAKTAADEARIEADAATKAAAEAQVAVDGLAVRMVEAETNIVQNSEQIALMATKEEVTETLGGYYTKEETDAAITVSADEIKASVASREEIQAVEDRVNETISEKETSILATSEAVIMSALESYVETENYDEFKSIVETQLSVMAGEISMNFATTTEQIEDVDGELQSKFAELNKHITFSDKGITISAGESQMSIRIDNDIVIFEKGGVQFGWWDGIDFHTGNIMVEVTERAQFGNFAFVPRSDGSLSFLKVEHRAGFYAILRGSIMIIYGAYPYMDGNTLVIEDIPATLDGTTLILTEG